MEETGITPRSNLIAHHAQADKFIQGTWGHIPIRHFHPHTHECYGEMCMTIESTELICDSCFVGFFSGSSSFVLGRGKNDKTGGTIVYVSAGDVLVLPAGTAHASVESSEDYKYIGVYPVVRPLNEIHK